MSVFKFFTAAWVSIFVYSLLSAFLGTSSFSSYEMIFAERERLIKNMEDLKAINQELEGSFAALQYDSDTIAVYARDLGYGTPNERFIRITGFPAAVKKRVTAGQQILPNDPQSVPNKTIHIIAFFAGFFTLMMQLILGLRKKKAEGIG